MDKLGRQLKAILAKGDVKALLDAVRANLANISGLIVIVEHPKGETDIHSSIVELETTKTYLINERLEGEYEDEDGGAKE